MTFKCFYVLMVFTQINFVFTGDNTCKGYKNQSPINLDTSKAVSKVFKPLSWNSKFSQTLDFQSIEVTTKSVTLLIDDRKVPVLSGGPLKDKYRLVNVHFHWGKTNKVGSEHTLNSKQYTMEMHAVFTRGNLSYQVFSDPDGIAVVAYLIEATTELLQKSKSVPVLEMITKLFPKISEKYREIDTNSKLLTLNDLVQPFEYDYLTYRSSLSYPPCGTNIVTWIIAPQILEVTQKQLKAFRDLYKRKLLNKADIWAKVQPLDGRKVYKAKRSNKWFFFI